jgi:hypothetical protein
MGILGRNLGKGIPTDGREVLSNSGTTKTAIQALYCFGDDLDSLRRALRKRG